MTETQSDYCWVKEMSTLLPHRYYWLIYKFWVLFRSPVMANLTSTTTKWLLRNMVIKLVILSFDITDGWGTLLHCDCFRCNLWLWSNSSVGLSIKCFLPSCIVNHLIVCEISDYLLNCSLKIHLSVSRLENIALLSAVNLLLAINSLDNYQKKTILLFLVWYYGNVGESVQSCDLMAQISGGGYWLMDIWMLFGS